MQISLLLTPLQSDNRPGILQLTLTGDSHSNYFPCLGP
jgi:hypothetical protein